LAIGKNWVEQYAKIHLLESPVVEQYITQYPKDGDNVVGKTTFSFRLLLNARGKVYIKRYPNILTMFRKSLGSFISVGYQPAQKMAKRP
jgi:hypothetical protein